MQKDEQTRLVEKFCADDCAGSSKDCGSDEHRGIEAKVSARVCWVRAAKGVGPTDFRPKKHELSTSAGCQLQVGCYMLRVIWCWSVTNNISFEVFSRSKSNRGKLVLWRSLGHMTFSSDQVFQLVHPIAPSLLRSSGEGCLPVSWPPGQTFQLRALTSGHLVGLVQTEPDTYELQAKSLGKKHMEPLSGKPSQMKIPNFSNNVII